MYKTMSYVVLCDTSPHEDSNWGREDKLLAVERAQYLAGQGYRARIVKKVIETTPIWDSKEQDHD